MTAPALPHPERLTDWEPTLVSDHRCVRCSDGEKPCVRGNPDGCEWRRTAPALLHADRLCAAQSITLPRQRRSRRLWAAAEFVLTGVGVLGAGLVIGVCLAIPS